MSFQLSNLFKQQNEIFIRGHMYILHEHLINTEE